MSMEKLWLIRLKEFMMPITHIVFENIAKKPSIVSMNRDYSFYGKVIYDAKMPELFLQARLDDDIINKYIAYYKIADLEKTRLLKDKNAKPSEEFLELYFEILSNKKLTEEIGSLLLPIMEFVDDKEYSHRYQELYDARKKITKAIAAKYEDKLVSLYNEYNKYASKDDFVESETANIKRRQIKNLA
jgi:aminopeptidase N